MLCIRRCFHTQDQYKSAISINSLRTIACSPFYALSFLFLLSACFFSFPFFACETLHRKAIWVFSSYHISKPRTIKKKRRKDIFRYTAASRFNPNTLQLKQPYTLDRYSPVLVSILILSPRSTNSGTFTLAPVSTVAGFVAP